MVAVLSLPPAPQREPLTAPQRKPLTARALALLLVALIHVVLLLALLFAARSPPKPGAITSTVVRLIPLAKPAAPKPKATAKPKSTPRLDVTKAPIPIVKMPVTKDTPPPLFKTEMFDAVDITKLPSHKGEQSAAAAEGSGETGSGTDAGSYGAQVGTGPHGEKLFAAEWYREPTRAEITPYLPKHLPDEATADIMCRTIDHFAVEDCQELGENPIGTGLSRAIRQAGWQFKVKPVRRGEKFEVGTWVRIHYTIVMHDAAAG